MKTLYLTDEQLEQAWETAGERLDDLLADPATDGNTLDAAIEEYAILDGIRSTRQAEGDYQGDL